MNRRVLQAIINVDEQSKYFCALVLKEIQLGKDDNKKEIWVESGCDTVLFVSCILLKEILEEEEEENYKVEVIRNKDECKMIIKW